MTPLEYDAGLEMLKAYKPDHPLMSTLESGHSRINVIYMQQALLSIDTQVNTVESDGDDLVTKNLHRERSRLYGERAKLSNTLHDCKSDQERAIISDRIEVVQLQINEANAKIKRYDESGTLPVSKFDNLPDDRYELYKIRENARKNIPRIEKALEELFLSPKATPGREKKIADKESKLKKLKLLKQYVEKRLEEKNIRS